MSKQAADKARARARRCECGHRRDAHGSRSDGGPIVSWCRDCDTECRFTAAEPGAATTPSVCPYPDKRVHPNRGAAEKAADRMHGKASGAGLTAQAFECRAGHWHVGRLTTPVRRP